MSEEHDAVRAADRLLIRDLPQRYACAMDLRDADALRALWEPQQEERLPWIDLGVIERAIIPAWGSLGRTASSIGYHVIDLQEDGRARGLVAATVHLAADGELIEQQILYRDEYRRDDQAGWRFVRRLHELRYGRVVGPDPWLAPPAHWPRSQTGAGVDPSSW